MSTAVYVNQVSKKFIMPGLPSFGRAPRRIARSNDGRLEEIHPQAMVALDCVSFTIQQAQIFGLVGPGGSGKSTMIRMLAALLKPDQGEVSVFGYDVARHSLQVQHLTNPVSGEASFFKQLSALENLLYGARLHGMNIAEARGWAVELLGRLGLDEQTIAMPMESLSRSVQQIVVIARAMLTRPPLLLLDEPLAGLDVHAKRQVLRVMQELRDSDGITVVIATRNWIETLGVCDCMAVLSEGKVVSLETSFRVTETQALLA